MKWFEKYFDDPNPPEQGFVIVPALDPILLGRQAEDALKNPAIQMALSKIEEEITRAWKTSAPKDSEAREHLYYRLEGLASFKAKLQGMVINMKIENNKPRQAEQAA
jgi:hypothetical protein